MGTLSCRRIVKNFGDVKVLKGIDVDAQEGEMVVLLGPSGCGKSTLLRIIAGLETLDSGSVHIDSDDISNIHPRNRNIAMVFQNYALFPLMTVRENLSFGMRINKVARPEISKKVAQVAEILGIGELLDRRPAQLSGGQRQRVAMGRAMVRDPRLFLFDEPLSNLDAKLRARMRVEIKELHQQIGVTTVYVTHDQMEAMTMADRLVVMREGKIEQSGVAEQVYHKPTTIYTASFLGSPEINLLEAIISDDGSCQAHGITLPLPDGAKPAYGSALVYGIRPHDILPCDASEAGALVGKVSLLELTGGFAIVHMQFGEKGNLVIQMQGDNHPVQGDTFAARINPACIHLFDKSSGARIGE